MKKVNYLLLLILISGAACQSGKKETSKRTPNILLIVADDLGYTDLGSFGGDIETPNLDALAQEGLSFRRFHTAPFCAVTRAMLLSGLDNHTAGMGIQGVETNQYGYEGHLTDRIIPVPALLKDGGYHTYMAGKWHLGDLPEWHPVKKGFEESFVTIEGGANHYSSRGIFKSDSISPYYENEKKVDWPEGAYSTNLYTDKLIEYIGKNQDDGKPFFAFAAYTAPHWPLQVDSSYWMKYQGNYDDGYEALRQRRFDAQKELGIIPKEAVLPELHPRVTPWDSLSTEEKKIEARKMELYAGMVDNLDENIGRLFDHLKETGEYENTLIVFFADNGAAAEDFYYRKGFKEFLQAKYTDAYEKMGTEESFISYGPQWAEAGAAPFRYFKGYTTEGGINTPMIVSGPGVTRKGEATEAYATLIDLAPTFYELSGLTYPESYAGKDIAPLKGEPMTKFLNGTQEQVHDSNYVFVLEHSQDILVRKGDYKLINHIRPFDEKNFELYNISTDLAEQKNLREAEPAKFQELLKEWYRYKEETKVQIPFKREMD